MIGIGVKYSLTKNLEVDIYSRGSQFEIAQMARVDQGLYDLDIQYHPNKENVVADALR